MNKQNVVVGVPDGASDACVRLGVGLDTLCAIGLRVIVQATREGHTTVATISDTWLGPVVQTKLDLQELARELGNSNSDPGGTPTV
jgi:hypothetical protein